MIRKDDLIMATKKEFTIEELEKAYEEHKLETDALKKKIEEMKQEEEERKKAQLALEQETRKKEVDAAFDKYIELKNAYVKDYGRYTFTKLTDDDIFPNPFFRSFF
jgi:hypothetical protein